MAAMAHRRKHGHAAVNLAMAAAPPTPAVIHPARSRWTTLGRAAVLVWVGGGCAALFAGALLQVGPFAWAAAWQSRHWGFNSVVLSALPGFAVLAATVVLLQLLPRRPDWPFLCGAQDVLSPRRSLPLTPPPPDRMARVLLRCAQLGLALSVLFPVAGGAAYVLTVAIGNRGAGSPLPELTLAALTQAALPGYARLTGAVPHPEARWVHDYTVRQTRYHTVYWPLTDPGWRPGDPVGLLEENSSVVGDGPASAGLAEPGPIEGRLERGALAGWMRSELRRTGVAVVGDPVVLVRRDLHGVVPGADMIGAGMAVLLGAWLGLFSLGISLAWLHRRRKLLRAASQP